MKLVGIGLCIIGVGLIVYDIVLITQSARIPKYIPKGKPAGTYDIDMEWEFPEE